MDQGFFDVSGDREIRLFRACGWALGGFYSLVGLWALIVGHRPFALFFGLLTLIFLELGLWQHRRVLRRAAAAGLDDSHGPLAEPRGGGGVDAGGGDEDAEGLA